MTEFTQNFLVFCFFLSFIFVIFKQDKTKLKGSIKEKEVSVDLDTEKEN